MERSHFSPVFSVHGVPHVHFGERRLGRAQGCDNCIYIEAGKGIGAGIVAGASSWRVAIKWPANWAT
ncbi:MAG: hypothetical protein DMG57_15420 [Acidobacteria bacterium]|nr:MAG: hypothetical protein DMG57_15420 [Acidobacteriota bacterium]